MVYQIYHFKVYNSKIEKEAENVDEGVDAEKARLQPQQSPKRIGNILTAGLKTFTAGLKTLSLHIPFYF